VNEYEGDPVDRGEVVEPEASEREPSERERPTPMTQQLGRIVLVIVAVLFVIFALANAHYVDFSWLFGETQVVEQGGERVRGGVPLIILLLVAFAAGAVVARLWSWQRKRHRR
jgi:uncharacterized integral membrane protein